MSELERFLFRASGVVLGVVLVFLYGRLFWEGCR
jgi:hypothetical protein